MQGDRVLSGKLVMNENNDNLWLATGGVGMILMSLCIAWQSKENAVLAVIMSVVGSVLLAYALKKGSG